MKRALMVLAMVALVGGCSYEDTESDALPEDSSETADPDLIDQSYLLNLRSEHPEVFVAVPDQKLIDNGHDICAAFDAGATNDDLMMAALDSGYSVAQGGWLVGSAIGAYCPEHG